MKEFAIVVVGGGLVGVACAAALARVGRSVLVLERHERLGQETSSRNSGVVHAGLYYPPLSLKMQLCLRGRALIEERAARGAFALRRIGKLVVAAEERERSELEKLAANAAAAGVPVELLDDAGVRELEPELRVRAALWSKATSIIDVDGLLGTYRREATAGGTTFAMCTSVMGLELTGTQEWKVTTRGIDGATHTVTCAWLVNAAGLDADRIAELAGLDVERLGLRQHPCKGSYFMLPQGVAHAISHLVYPLPREGGLGIHLTFDLAGGLRAGPDAEYVSTLSYEVDESKRDLFAQAIARYLPGVRPADLVPAFAGVRPKLAGPADPFRDFVVRHEAALGFPGLVNLLGIESPGLTASPAIAELVARWITLEDTA